MTDPSASPPRPVPPVGRRAWTATWLSVLFLIVYGACNYLTTLRSDVGTWVMAFERVFPFVPVLILPYLSIDLFFVGAPFLCRSEEELCAVSRRIATAVLVAAGFFLVLPLRFAFERPAAPGFWGRVFDGFRMMDAPHNLFPSLHVALLGILADVWLRRVRSPAMRVALFVWFFLVLISTVLTYQHHLVDVAGGALLAAICFHLFPGERLPVIPNPAIGRLYAAGAALLVAAGLLTRPWGAFLAWPAFALGSAAAAYFGRGPGLYRKRDGRIPVATKIALAPLLLGQRLSLARYRRVSTPWDEVMPGLFLGRQLDDAEAAAAVRRGVTAVLDLTAELETPAPFRDGVRRLALPVLDLTAPTPAQMEEAARFIALESARGVVLVHCKVGWSRSAAVVGAHLVASGRARSGDEAVAQLRAARPSLFVRPEALEALRSFTPAR